MNEPKNANIDLLNESKARTAEEAIGHSQSLVTVLRLTEADLKPVEDALAAAKQLFDAHQYSKALNAAKKAESLAITLDERFNEYEKAATALRSRIAAMQRLGLRTEPLESIPRLAEDRVLAGIWDNGAFVPNYLEARVFLERAEQEGRVTQERAERASSRIFMAEVAIESLTDMKGPADPAAFAMGAAAGLEQALQDATKELAVGNSEGARLIAKDIEVKAVRRKTRCIEATKSLDGTEAHLTELRGEGVLTQSFEGQIKMARDMLGKGLIEPAAAMAARLQGEAKAFGEQFRKATTGLSDAEILYTRLQREGFHSYDAELAIRDARRTVREGNYARTIDHLGRALRAFAQRTNARAALGKAIEGTRRRVQLLQGTGLSFLPDIQEVLGRAEREFQQGNLSGSSEDLRLATVLLEQVTTASSGKK